MLTPSFAWFALTYYLLAGLGVNLGYHRVLSHRSLKLAKWLERVLVTVGLPAGTPIQGREIIAITTRTRIRNWTHTRRCIAVSGMRTWDGTSAQIA